MIWYYIKDGRRGGPVEEQVLVDMARDGLLMPDDMVWNQTMADKWNKAATVPGLFPLPASSGQEQPLQPPPLEPQTGKLPGVISCVDPVGHAWSWTRTLLFNPFDLGKWFSLGFSAWLAAISQGGLGGGGSGWNLGNKNSGFPWGGNGAADFLSRATEFMHMYFALIIAAVAVVAILVTGISVLLLWVGSRGKFMFLDNVVNRRERVAEPWREYRTHGNSLFLWKLVYGLVCIAVLLFLVALAAISVVVPCVRAGTFVLSCIPWIVTVLLLMLVFLVIAGFIGRFLEDFIVPIMYKSNVSATKAWNIFMGLLKGNSWKFVVYVLFYLVLQMAAGVIIVALVVLTCCCAGCLLLIPYVGTVLLLPVSVFFRTYSIQYLAQYGPEFRQVARP